MAWVRVWPLTDRLLSGLAKLSGPQLDTAALQPEDSHLTFKEAIHQKMYRCMFDVLRGSLYATPEFSTVAKGSGCIDLMIKELGWGNEFVLKGSGAGEHHYRFDTNGPYGQ